MLTMSKSSTTIESDWLHIPHAGELLVSEFMEPLQLDTSALAKSIEVDQARLQALIDGSERVDGELDLRLTDQYGNTLDPSIPWCITMAYS